MCRGIAKETCKHAELLRVLRKWSRHETMRENFFSQTSCFGFSELTQHFEVAVSGAIKVTGLKPHLQSHLENLISKYERLYVF